MRHVTSGYALNEPAEVRLLKNAVIYFAPITTPLDNQYLGKFNLNQTVCDPNVPNELADRILSPEAEHAKDILLNLIRDNKFDMILTFSAGGNDVQSPISTDEDPLFAKLRLAIEEQRIRESVEVCAPTPNRIHQSDAIQRITNTFIRLYKVPLFTIQLGCCKMPEPDKIATAWRRNLHKILNFLKLTETGVQGVVKDVSGRPLRDAIVSVKGTTLTAAVTKNMATFRFILPAGDYKIEIGMPGIPKHSLAVNIQQGVVLNAGDIVIGGDSTKSGSNHTSENAELQLTLGGEVHGYVLDTQNHPIKNAKLTLVNSNVQLANFTDLLGGFQIIGTPLGSVSLSVMAPGYYTGEK